MMMEDMDQIPNASLVNKLRTSEESKTQNASTEKILKDKRCEYLAYALWQTTNVTSDMCSKVLNVFFLAQGTKWSTKKNSSNKKMRTVILMDSTTLLRATERFLATCATKESKWTQLKKHAQAGLGLVRLLVLIICFMF